MSEGTGLLVPFWDWFHSARSARPARIAARWALGLCVRCGSLRIAAGCACTTRQLAGEPRPNPGDP